MVRRTVLTAVTMALLACEPEARDAGAPAAQTGRWYSAAQMEQGAQVFAQNCAVCHGERAQGLSDDWRQRLDDGSLPPPPLNGSAHAWHHPLPVLLQVINQGGAEFGGKMPGFAELLSEQERLAAIAYFQSFWSEEIYAQWQQMGGTD
ncbi:MAG: cytochrome c [Pseudohongiellaceae bacterium]